MMLIECDVAARAVTPRERLAEFPLLSPRLDAIDHVVGWKLACYYHCLRDALYAYGVQQVVEKLVQPLNLVVERTPAGRLLTIYGGQDTHYFEPVFHQGLISNWVDARDDDHALEIIEHYLDEGKAVPAMLDLSHMPHSKFYKFPNPVYRHTVLVAGLDVGAGTALIADSFANKEASFLDNRGTLSLDALRVGLRDTKLLLWDLRDDATAPDRQFRALIEQSIAQMTAPALPESGLAAIPTLPRVFAEVRGAQARKQRAIFRLAGAVLRQVAGDRFLFGRYVEIAGDKFGLHVAQLATTVRNAAEAWSELARTLFIRSSTWESDDAALLASCAERIYRLESLTVDLLGSCR